MENSKILINKIDNLIITSLVLLLISLLLLNYSDIDIYIQNFFFNSENKTWLIDSNEPIKKFIFYNLPKLCFGAFMLIGIITTIAAFKNKSPFLYKYRHKLLITLLGLILIPLIAGNIKKFTNVYCPSQLEIYNGKNPYVRIFEPYPSSFTQIKKGKCFPAGHAVTGFSLVILFFTLNKRKHKILGLLLGLILGWILGLYQMAKGAHFFGHTFVAMITCFLIAALIARIYESLLAKKSL